MHTDTLTHTHTHVRSLVLYIFFNLTKLLFFQKCLPSPMVNMIWIKERCAIPFFFLSHRLKCFSFNLLYSFFSCSTHTHRCRLKCTMLWFKKHFFLLSPRARVNVCSCSSVCMCVRAYVSCRHNCTTSDKWQNQRKMTERSNKRVNGRKLPLYEWKKNHVKWKKTFIALAHQTTGTKTLRQHSKSDLHVCSIVRWCDLI